MPQDVDYGTVQPIEKGNIQWYNRPKVSMSGGKYGTVYSISREENGKEVLVPQIYDGKLHTADEAWEHYKKTGQHMGKFKSVKDANYFGEKYHNDAAAGKYDMEKQTVEGPDGKKYSFSKGLSQERIDKYFTKQGYIKKDGEWYTQSGEKTSDLLKTPPGGVSQSVKFGSGSRKTTTELKTGEQIKKSAAVDYAGASLPSIGGAVGGMVGKTPGAAIGGALGEGLKDITQRILYGDISTSDKQVALNMLKEGAIQGGLQKVGDKAGDVFFKLLDKIPHAVIKKGIKLLPSDLQEGGKVYKYVEDLLSNLAPSAKTMEEFKSKQSASIIDKVDKLVKGYAKFDGTSEEMGVLLQKALRSGREASEDQLDILMKGYKKKGFSKLQAQQYLQQTQIYKDFVHTYENELMKKIVGTNKPELIAGLLRSSKAALEETRIVGDTLKELSPDMLGKVQNRIMRDVLSETLTGSKDPTAKGVQALTSKFSGNKFKDALDTIGEEKLKAIYGETKYKAIEDFVKLIGNVGNTTQGSGVGRFLNLMFLMPFRGGVTGKAMMKLTGTAFIFNRAAKVITSTEGMRLYENYIRATTQNAPRAIKLAVDEINKYNERSDQELVQEQKEIEEQYYKDNPKEKPKGK